MLYMKKNIDGNEQKKMKWGIQNLLLDPVNYSYHANNLLFEINLESTLAM